MNVRVSAYFSACFVFFGSGRTIFTQRKSARKAFEKAVGKCIGKSIKNIRNKETEEVYENVTEKCAGKHQKTSVMRKQKEHLKM